MKPSSATSPQAFTKLCDQMLSHIHGRMRRFRCHQLLAATYHFKYADIVQWSSDEDEIPNGNIQEDGLAIISDSRLSQQTED